MSETIVPTYNRLPINFVRGSGAWLWSDRNEKYLDALAGIAVCNLGHCHPAVTAAIKEQAETLLHTSNVYQIPAQQKLADKLTELSGMSQVFFGNSGAEANEACLKLARKYGHDQGIEAPEIIVAKQSFHGRTIATISATGNEKIQAGFEPLLTGFHQVDHGDIEAIKTLAKQSNSIVAVHVEPIVGEGGVLTPPDDYLVELRALCDQNNWLLMLDEVQTGVGRTGKWFAHQHAGITPDVMALAKGLGNGMPIGACVVAGKAVGVLQAGNHGSTFGGNPLACHTALAVLNSIADDNVMANCQKQSKFMLEEFASAFKSQPGVTSIRGKGLMIGIELAEPCGSLVQAALDAKLLINVTAGNVIRLLPPLIINESEAKQITATIIDIVNNFCSQSNVA